MKSGYLSALQLTGAARKRFGTIYWPQAGYCKVVGMLGASSWQLSLLAQQCYGSCSKQLVRYGALKTVVPSTCKRHAFRYFAFMTVFRSRWLCAA